MDNELSFKLNWTEVTVVWTTEHFGKWPVGRIRLLPEISGSDKWEWAINLHLPLPTSCHGRTASLSEAETAFRRAWKQFLPTIAESNLRDAFDTYREAVRRAQRLQQKNPAL